MHSPGPARYSAVEAAAKLEKQPWVKKTSLSSFNREARNIDLTDKSRTDRAELPGPNHYASIREEVNARHQAPL